jgi:uncharacterized membrane protein YgcG
MSDPSGEGGGDTSVRAMHEVGFRYAPATATSDLERMQSALVKDILGTKEKIDPMTGKKSKGVEYVDRVEGSHSLSDFDAEASLCIVLEASLSLLNGCHRIDAAYVDQILFRGSEVALNAGQTARLGNFKELHRDVSKFRDQLEVLDQLDLSFSTSERGMIPRDQIAHHVHRLANYSSMSSFGDGGGGGGGGGGGSGGGGGGGGGGGAKKVGDRELKSGGSD